ncbi:MAG: hypothetical protein QOE58_675, partial [Actinomycetota bacterium]|nr:hypothetical protein [Actinomycetota bacterium]
MAHPPDVALEPLADSRAEPSTTAT